MAAKASAVGLFLLLLPCSLSEDRIIYIGRVMDALEKVVNYYKLNYEDLNVDGLFGLRVVEGHLDLLLQEYEIQGRHHNLSSDIISRLKNMKSISTVTSNDAVAYVKRDDEEYFEKLKLVVGKPWNFLKRHRELQNQLRWNADMYFAQRKNKLKEDVSDRCMGELMGTNGDSNGKACQISSFCIRTMTAKGLSGYGITHQLLWTMLAEQHGCFKTLDSMLTERGEGSLEAFRDEFCANNFYEMTDFINNHLHGTVTPKVQDLFLEQQFVCPSLGYYQFLSYSFLDQILSWQKPPGCYGVMKRPETSVYKDGKMDKNEEIFSDYTYEDDIKNPDISGILPNLKQQNTSNKKSNQLQVPERMIGNNNFDKIPSLGENRLTGDLKPVGIARERPPNIRPIVPNAQVKQNTNVIIQKGNGLVGKFDSKLGKGTRTEKNNGVLQPEGNVIEMDSKNFQLHPTGKTVGNGQHQLVNVMEKGQQLNREINNAMNVIRAPNIGIVSKGKEENSAFLNKKSPAVGSDQDNINDPRNPIRIRDIRGVMGSQAMKKIVYTGRQLLAEKAMKEGCLAHKTAVAAGALVMYLRYLIDPGPMDIQHNIPNANQHRFLMSSEVNRQTGVLKQSSNNTGVGQRNSVGKSNMKTDDLVKSLRDRAQERGGMNGQFNNLMDGDESNQGFDNNILQAQLNLNSDDGEENYYAQDDNEDDGYDDKKKDLYNQNPDQQHRLVPFNVGNGPVIDARVGLKDVHGGYDEDDYKDENDNQNGDGDYDEEKALHNVRHEVNHIQIGRKPVIPKEDETDYTYYDENDQHNGYNVNNNNEEEDNEDEIKQKVLPPVEVDDGKADILKNEVLSAETHRPFTYTSPSSPPNTLFITVCFCMLLVVFFMYRFIKSRRVHIRYHPRSFVPRL